MSAFEVGKDYSGVVWDFLRWLLLDFLLPQIKNEGKIYDDVRTSIKGVADVLGKGTAVRANAYAARADAAAAAAADAYAARADAYAAAYADAYADVADAYAARAAAAAADVADAYAARADAYAAYVYTARTAAAAYVYTAAAADADARADAYKIFADKLIELIKEI